MLKKAVFDASFFLSFLLSDEKQTKLNKIVEFKEGRLILVEPFLFTFEVLNALRYACGAKRISPIQLERLVKYFQNLENIDYIFDFDFTKLISLAIKNNISIYDASYLYLHQVRGLKLYTLDKKLESLASAF